MVEKIAGLIAETSSSLPRDVEKALAAALRREERGGSAAVVLRTILDNVATARHSAPRGVPAVPGHWDACVLRGRVAQAQGDAGGHKEGRGVGD